ncbi:hypothetical protein K1719_016265 [Acacia pycnantha]|nr:hypothetical protein K1719_016265 [Acacia pycnantha]
MASPGVGVDQDREIAGSKLRRFREKQHHRGLRGFREKEHTPSFFARRRGRVYKEETEEMEAEMEIGYPTEVKHLTHIGLDGSTTTTNDDKGWDNLKPPPELLSLSSISFKQFEIAMAAQAHHPPMNDLNSKFG